MTWGELKAMLDIEVDNAATVSFCLDPDGDVRMFEPTKIHANVGDEVEVEIKQLVL